MNYPRILRDSAHLVRTNKLIWIYSFLSLLTTSPAQVEKFIRGNSLLVCIYWTLGFAISILSLIGVGSLIFVIHQASMNRSPTFADAWYLGVDRIFRMLGLAFLLVPVLIIFLLLTWIVGLNAPAVQNGWFLVRLIEIIEVVSIGSLFVFGSCAIVIHEVNALRAAWTGILITLNNLFHVFIMIGVWFTVRTILIECVVIIVAVGLYKTGPLAMDYHTYLIISGTRAVALSSWIIDLLLWPLTVVILTRAYLQFTQKISYPALSKRQEVG